MIQSTNSLERYSNFSKASRKWLSEHFWSEKRIEFDWRAAKSFFPTRNSSAITHIWVEIKTDYFIECSSNRTSDCEHIFSIFFLHKWNFWWKYHLINAFPLEIVGKKYYYCSKVMDCHPQRATFHHTYISKEKKRPIWWHIIFGTCKIKYRKRIDTFKQEILASGGIILDTNEAPILWIWWNWFN